jgi:zinc transport system substrate-binding protein
MIKSHFRKDFLQACVALILFLFHTPILQAAPNVVISIKPVHSLISGIMQGVGEPKLLIKGAQSPHHFSLRPSDMSLLQQAELIIWVGPGVEASMADLFDRDVIKGRVVTLTQLGGMTWLPPRKDHEWETPEHQHESHAGSSHVHGQAIDSHIWLSPDIARGIVRQITDLLCDLDRANASRYRENQRLLVERLDRLDTELKAKLSPVRQIPYVVFHDAYHYLEQHYHLNAVGSVSINPEQQPGIRHIHELRSKIIQLKARCLFSEPQFQPKLVQTLIEGTEAKAGQLDPLGSDLDAGPDAYFQLMQRLADNLVSCLH